MTVGTKSRLEIVRPAPSARVALTSILVLAVVVAGLGVDWTGAMVHGGGMRAASEIARSLLTPDLSPGFLIVVGEATLVTVAYAISGMTVAVAVGLPGAVLVAGVLARRPWSRLASTVVARGLFGALRAVHELVWALLLLTILGLTPIAGVLAIGIPYGATLARVLGEHLQNVAPEPLEALRSCGATPWQALAYARVPMASADILAYLAYRLECAVRAAAVLSFIGLGGIGYRLTLALADLRFDRVWPLLAVLVVLIACIDTVSGRVRQGLPL